MPFQQTLALFKPDLVSSGHSHEVLSIIVNNGLHVICQQTLLLDEERASSFYAEHQGKPFFKNLVNFMTSGPIISLVLAGENAISNWRQLMGHTNIDTAKSESPHSVRALFAQSTTSNAVHGSDSPAAAEREIKFFFPDSPVFIPNKNSSQQMIRDQLSPVLRKALTEMLKSESEITEPIHWLGTYLINSNSIAPTVEE
ncbi:hypothetical protein GEMRC1_000679 [Eukaryota sp. GEM-RC1]